MTRVETVAYGPHPSQVVDFHLPARGAAPDVRVTLLHGGFWREAYDRAHLVPLATELAERGLEVALAEYRRVGGGGGWPETFDDVVRAAGTRRDAPAARRHVLVGHSAGGHLALWAASSPAAGAVAVDHVVALAPVADLARARELGLSRGAVGELVAPDREHAADPMRLPPPRVPVTLVHGTRDEDVPVDLSRAYARAARAAGAAVELTVLEGAGHYEPITPGTPGCAAWAASLTTA
ncbi:hypothetical protein BLA24_18740 [Streptomyces cinnamoneus]|uniref:BD-FAE-like domain-containing protein n=1 Tax=Streptomyces cinnamoneus TaxID=53446 RepID=A0A2G1XHV8_STRCJ|nr:alpha/beta hydrolase [Streptomyces cinnamoneus]PHQ50806.1 hypothetical protein BLA24_18740 [Streptomyces cinnamoneus]PPT13936.1 alpha/beta hydrolase [Streptomyces cinnamoneus]